MGGAQRIEYEGAVYHVAVRGNGCQAIFADEAGRAHFVRVLGESVGAFDAGSIEVRAASRLCIGSEGFHDHVRALYAPSRLTNSRSEQDWVCPGRRRLQRPPAACHGMNLLEPIGRLRA